MDVQMHAQEFSLTPSLRDHLHRRLASAFGRTREHVVRVVVRLRDLNGPRGGRDKVCHVSVALRGRPEVVVQDVCENMYVAIDRALKRAAYRVVQHASRRRRILRLRPASGVPL